MRVSKLDPSMPKLFFPQHFRALEMRRKFVSIYGSVLSWKLGNFALCENTWKAQTSIFFPNFFCYLLGRNKLTLFGFVLDFLRRIHLALIRMMLSPASFFFFTRKTNGHPVYRGVAWRSFVRLCFFAQKPEDVWQCRPAGSNGKEPGSHGKEDARGAAWTGGDAHACGSALVRCTARVLWLPPPCPAQYYTTHAACFGGGCTNHCFFPCEGGSLTKKNGWYTSPEKIYFISSKLGKLKSD